MEQFTIYRAKGKEIGLIFLFKYDLNGNIKAFEIEEGESNGKQMKWLFSDSNFPADESIMKTIWLKDEKYTKIFIVEVSPADLSFEALYNLFDNKVGKVDAQKSFNKLKQGDVIKCFIEVPYYLQYLKKNPGISQLYLATYINKRRFEDERAVKIGKNNNSVLHELAKQKTEK
jgi:hypothetical protein